MKFAEERTEHHFTLSGTDIDVMRPENFLMEFVLMEKSEGWKSIIILDLFYFICCCKCECLSLVTCLSALTILLMRM